jgi:xanthine dehydrogenase YagR molybdenum-binding subunit
LVGWGMATSTYPTNRQAASAEVQLRADGTAVVRSGTQDLGTGTYTVMTQIAAEALGLPVGRVRFELGDSMYPAAPVSGGSQTVASVGPAVQAACNSLRAKVFALARTDPDPKWKHVDPASLRLEDGVVSGPPGRVRLAELLARQKADAIEARADVKPGEERQKYSMHAFGAQFAEVRIDPDLGTIRLTRFVGAFDCGRQMNALTVQSQLIGGITYGIGMALLEATNMDESTGRFTNANLADYLVPVNADVPAIQAIVVSDNDTNSNPLGAKGVGELPMVGVAAAIANAVWHATGKRVRKLPIRINDILES